ncbi:MAG: hypothetical protein HDT18_06335 [Oscillibacter sp.]|nr:hypothetical protein [Oscillibacter sp.]
MYDTEFEVIPYDWEEEMVDRYIRNIFRLDDAAKNGDWEKVSSLIILNPDIMEGGLKRVYPLLPDEYKFSIPTECQTHNGDRMPGVRKYVRQARKYAPIEKRIPREMIALPEVEIYRAGEEPLDKAAYRISWTTSIDVARWFYNRAIAFQRPQRHIYKGIIKPEQIIWYTDGRKEKEVMQYNSVKNIVEIER